MQRKLLEIYIEENTSSSTLHVKVGEEILAEVALAEVEVKGLSYTNLIEQAEHLALKLQEVQAQIDCVYGPSPYTSLIEVYKEKREKKNKLNI